MATPGSLGKFMSKMWRRGVPCLERLHRVIMLADASHVFFQPCSFGDNYPQMPYHKSSYNAYIDYPMRGRFQDEVEGDFTGSKTAQRFILYGAVEGGPNIDDTYHDDRTNYEYSEVTQDYNAAWTGAIAGLIDYYGFDKFEPYTDCGLDLGWTHPNASAQPAWPADDCYHTCNKGCPRGQMASSHSWKMLMNQVNFDGTPLTSQKLVSASNKKANASVGGDMNSSNAASASSKSSSGNSSKAMGSLFALVMISFAVVF
jgi:Glycosyl hydrolase family 9